MYQQYLIIHYGEIALKGLNRPFFEHQLINNIRKVFKTEDYDFIKRISGRIIIKLNENLTKVKVKSRLSRGFKKIFGIVCFSFSWNLNQDFENLKKDIWELVKNTSFKSFKIDTRRAQKNYPLNSQQINEKIGAYVKDKSRAKVDLKSPNLTIFIEIVEKYAFCYFKKIKGPGGLPVGVSGKVASLISSGIDSPVASWKMMKRGCEVIFCHFHSYPFTNKASQENVLKIINVLNNWQQGFKVYFIPFSEIQKRIIAASPPRLRIILYRRAMLYIAQKIAQKENAKALVTGESVGQVASQTLDNIAVISQAVKLPVLRPLIGMDKEEIIKQAKKIGTYGISILPYEDCCSLLVSEHPAIKANLRQVLDIEKGVGLNELLKSVDLDKIQLQFTSRKNC